MTAQSPLRPAHAVPSPRPGVAQTLPQALPSPIHLAEDLTGPAGRARIALGDQVYDLRITRAGKLILTK